MVSRVRPQCLRRLEVPITFDHQDYQRHVPSRGHFSLIISPIVRWACLTKVSMDGGSSINILYTDTLDHIGILRKGLYPGGAPFFGVIPRTQATPLRSI